MKINISISAAAAKYVKGQTIQVRKGKDWKLGVVQLLGEDSLKVKMTDGSTSVPDFKDVRAIPIPKPETVIIPAKVKTANVLDLKRLASSIEWIDAYILSSMSMQSKFLSVPFVRDTILKPLYALVSPPAPIKLFRVQIINKDLAVGDTYELNASKSVVSWTQAKTLSDWEQIADDVGVLGEDNLYVVESEKPLNVLTTKDYIKKLQKAVAKLDLSEYYKTYEFLAADPEWQQEAIVDCTAPTSVIVRAKLD